MKTPKGALWIGTFGGLGKLRNGEFTTLYDQGRTLERCSYLAL